MEILSRVKPSQIEKSLYKRFLNNDYETSMTYAYDIHTLNSNKAVVCYDDISYKIEKIDLTISDDDMLEIVISHNFGLRLDKLLSDELNVSRTKIKSLFESQMIICDDESMTLKSKVKGTIKLKFKEINT